MSETPQPLPPSASSGLPHEADRSHGVNQSPGADQPSGARRVGIVGAGQLARMMLGPAIELGLATPVLATDPAESAAAVAGQVLLGRHDDAEAVQALADEVDVV
ncbi:MAG: hypothetical protein ACTH6N_04795, partial [Brachybacterium tyrofermentans]